MRRHGVAVRECIEQERWLAIVDGKEAPYVPRGFGSVRANVLDERGKALIEPQVIPPLSS